MNGQLWAGLALSILAAMSALGFSRISLVEATVWFVGGALLVDGWTKSRSKHVEDAEVARDLMAKMIARAKKRIILTSGSLDANAYVHWRDGEIGKCLGEQIGRGIVVEILCGDIDAGSRKMVKSWLDKSNLRLYRTYSDPVPHGLLIDDDRELRIESPHLRGSPERKNVYIKRPEVAADLFLARVNRYKENSEQIMGNEKN